MALIKCAECGKEISEFAPVCPVCGKPSLKKKRVGCLTLVAVLFFGFILIAIFTPSQKSPTGSQAVENQVNFTDIEKSVKELTDSGFIKKINPELNEVFVSRNLWNTTTYDQKKTIGYVLGHFCGYKKGTGLYWVDIRDQMSGKKLAKWSKSWGMKVEE